MCNIYINTLEVEATGKKYFGTYQETSTNTKLKCDWESVFLERVRRNLITKREIFVYVGINTFINFNFSGHTNSNRHNIALDYFTRKYSIFSYIRSDSCVGRCAIRAGDVVVFSVGLLLICCCFCVSIEFCAIFLLLYCLHHYRSDGSKLHHFSILGLMVMFSIPWSSNS